MKYYLYSTFNLSFFQTNGFHCRINCLCAINLVYRSSTDTRYCSYSRERINPYKFFLYNPCHFHTVILNKHKAIIIMNYRILTDSTIHTHLQQSNLRKI